jgi:hypothetical protein
MLWFTKHGVQRGTPSKHIGILEGIHQLGHHCHSIFKSWHTLNILIEKNYSSFKVFEEQRAKKLKAMDMKREVASESNSIGFKHNCPLPSCENVCLNNE